MALTYGFYNSIEGDRVYDAIQFGRIFDGIIKDGVYATYEKGMMVIASENPSEVIIQPGRAWFNHTWSYNDANVIFEAPAPEVLLERYDALVLEINEELSARENSYKWVTGTPSSRPERPTLTNTTTIHQYPLCYVHRYPETTMIYARDITNMIGTSECPFVTGVLEGIDLDAWINQWDDEFHSWENSKKTQFEAWMLSQETTFTTWYNAFKDQMAADVQEVEDFVDYLESVLDASTAIHLQEEIDELKNEISSGSHITVTTINPELYGRNVTITEAGGTVFTEKFDNTGVAVFKSVPYVGNLTISSTYGTQTAERVVNTPYYARYEFAIAFWAATVNIVSDPEMSGSSVTVKDSEEAIVGTVVLDSEGTGVYTAIKPDTYKFTLTYGGETMEVTLSVTQETTYTVDLHAAGFKWQDWLEAGGVTGSYSSLDDVLADEVALRRLFTVHASVDYMADIRDENEDVETIINNDLCAKWINLRDYALDTLYANTIIKGYMDTADKYFYGEWALVGQVPTMTSNTAPYGTASGTGVSSTSPYMAFDGNNSTAFTFAQSSYLRYQFVNPTKIKKVYFYGAGYTTGYTRSVIIQASNDASTWVDLKEVTLSADDLNTGIYVDVPNENAYTYYQITPNGYEGGAGNISLNICQFYAWAPKGNVPVMTSATAPYGEVLASTSFVSNREGYKAFDENDSTLAMISITSGGESWIGYKAVNPIKVKKVHLDLSTNNAGPFNTTVYIDGSNDASTWTPLKSVQTTYSLNYTRYLDIDVDSEDYYLYHRVRLSYSYNPAFNIIQFYGRELSVSIPTMTSNNAPYGEASASTQFAADTATMYAFKAFDGNKSNNTTGQYWQPNINENNSWIKYRFNAPTKVNLISLYIRASQTSGSRSFKLEASDDDSTYETLIDSFTVTGLSTAASYNLVSKTVDVPTTKAYRYYKLSCIGVFVSSNSTNIAQMKEIEMFGLDYSEKEFEEGATKKWLYDHGVELEAFTAYTTGSGIAEKLAEELYIHQPSAANSGASFYTDSIDLTPYNLMRGIVGKISKSFTSVYGRLAVGPTYTDVITGNSWLGNSTFTVNNMPNNNGFDISAIDQSTRVMFMLGGGTAQLYEQTLTELWLE